MIIGAPAKGSVGGVLSGVLCLLANSPGLAAETSRFELTPFAGYRIGGEFEDEATGTDFELDDSGSFGLIFNARASDITQYEIYLGRQETDIDLSEAGGEPEQLGLDVSYYHVGGTYLFEANTVEPYMVATLGATRMEPAASELSNETFFSFAIGGGVRLFPQRRFGLRLDGRLFGTVTDSDSSYFCSVGPEGNICAIQSSASILWQWEMAAGLIFRF